MKKTPTLLPVVAVALVREDGRVLLQQRPAQKAHGGLWEFPGGKVEPGETPPQAAVRELEEELAVTPTRLVPLTFAADDAIVILLYTCPQWRGAPVALDAQALDWFLPEDFASLPMPPLDVLLAQAVKNAIQGLAKPNPAP